MLAHHWTTRLTFCAALAVSTPVTADTIKIGYVATMSGQAAQLGIDSVDGFKLALGQLGGKLGGAPAELIVADDQLKPEIGVEHAKRLMDKEQASIIVGTTFSNVLMAVVQPVTRAGVFLISPNAGPSVLAGAGCHPNFFSIAFLNDQIYEPIGEYLQRKGVKSVVALAPNYRAGKDAIAGFKHTFKGEILDEIYTPLAQLDFSSELTRIAVLKPEAVFAFYPGGLAVNFVKQYDQAGLKKQFSLYGGFPLTDGTVRNAEGKAALGIMTSGNWALDLPNAENKAFIAKFKAAYGRDPTEFAAYGYDTAMLIDSAIAAVKGDLSKKDDLRAALRAAKFKSVRGNFSFNTNHFPVQDWYVRNVVADGEGTRLETLERLYTAAKDRLASQCKMK